jgi:anti-sigma B factor antagonist
MDIPRKMTITSKLTGEVVIFDIQGEFSRVTAEAPTLSELVKSQLGAGRRRILFDFEATGFVDSFGVSEMLASYVSIHDLGGALKLCRVPPKLLLTLKVTGIEKVLPIYPSPEAALAAFALPPAPGVD